MPAVSLLTAWDGQFYRSIGLLGYLGYVALRTGRLEGWFSIQQGGWQTHIDGGAQAVTFLWRQLINPWSLMCP